MPDLQKTGNVEIFLNDKELIKGYLKWNLGFFFFFLQFPEMWTRKAQDQVNHTK